MSITDEDRFFWVCQTIKTLGFCIDYDYGDERLILVFDEEHDWAIYLPDTDSADVVIGFHKDVDPNFAADIAMRFCRLPELYGFDVRVTGAFAERNFVELVDSSDLNW